MNKLPLTNCFTCSALVHREDGTTVGPSMCSLGIESRETVAEGFKKFLAETFPGFVVESMAVLPVPLREARKNFKDHVLSALEELPLGNIDRAKVRETLEAVAQELDEEERRYCGTVLLPPKEQENVVAVNQEVSETQH